MTEETQEEVKEYARGDWLSKQHQRVEESWKIHSPIAILMQVVLLIATLATLAWGIQLAMSVVALLLLGAVGYLWVSGYIMDRTGYLQRRSSRLLQMTQTIPIYHQYKLAAALTGLEFAEVLAVAFADFNPKAIKLAEKRVEEELLWFGEYHTGSVGKSDNDNSE